MAVLLSHRQTPYYDAVLSLTLFNLYVADFPELASESTSFADDFSLFASAVVITELETKLSEDLEKVLS